MMCFFGHTVDVDISFSEKEVNLIQGIISSLLPIKLEFEKLQVITGKPVMPIENYRKPVIQNLSNFGFPNDSHIEKEVTHNNFFHGIRKA